MVPRWVRGQESAVIVDPPEHPIAMLGLGGSVATPPTGLEADVLVVKSFQDLDAAARRGQGQDRALQRALHQLRRDGAVPLGRGRGRGPARRRGRVRPRGRADGPAHAAHRQHELRRRAGEDPDGRDRRRGRQSHPAADRPRPAGARPAADGGPHRARRRVGQRASPRSPAASGRTRSSWSAATSTRGTSAPARRTTASAASSPGRRCG